LGRIPLRESNAVVCVCLTITAVSLPSFIEEWWKIPMKSSIEPGGEPGSNTSPSNTPILLQIGQ
jgi:hypothetical protein